MSNMIFYGACCLIFAWLAYSAYERFDEALSDWIDQEQTTEFHLHDDEEVFPGDGKMFRMELVRGVFRNHDSARKNGLITGEAFVASELNTMGVEYGTIITLQL